MHRVFSPQRVSGFCTTYDPCSSDAGTKKDTRVRREMDSATREVVEEQNHHPSSDTDGVCYHLNYNMSWARRKEIDQQNM